MMLAALGLALLAAGCAVGYTATVADDGYGPDLVYAAPGVQVVADYDEPVFFADSFYWRFSGGYWYRSPYYNRGWVSARPPGAVLRIDRPQAYAHYRPQGWAPRGRSLPPPAVARERRDDRARFEGRPPPRPVYQAAPPPRAAPSGGWRGAPPPPPAMRAAPPAPRAAPPPPASRPRPSGGGEHHDRH